MDRATAWKFSTNSLKAASMLTDILPELRKGCDDKEFAFFLKAIGTVTATLCDEIINPIHKQFPDFENLADKLAQNGNLK